MPTVRHAWNDTATAFAAAGLGQARAEAAWILEQLLGVDRAWLQLHGATELPAAVAARLAEFRRRRLAGEPLQYLLGDVEFCGLRLEVGPGVLIPRPETERLVELALAATAAAPAAPLLDLCTGSGAVALALAAARPQAAVTGVDLSPAALAWARRNAARLGLVCTWLEGDLFAPLPAAARFAAITANPPYIPDAAYAALPAEVREHEPQLALVAGADGLAVLRRIAAAAPHWLRPGGLLACEISSEQAAAVIALFTGAGLRDAQAHDDLYGAVRFVSARRPAAG